MGESRGSIAFFTTYRPPVPLDIYSCPVPSSKEDNQPLPKEELHLTDGVSYNYNGQVIPPGALKTLLRRPQLASVATEADVDAGRLTGLIFVSERERNLETLHIALRFNRGSGDVKVFSLADVFGNDSFSGIRMEDSGCIAGGYVEGNRTVDHYLIYVSTKEPVQDRRCPWTVVYKTNLRTGETERLTPPGAFDLSPSVSPSGKNVAVASFQGKDWDGEIEDLKTAIYVMNVETSHRKWVIDNAGWPTWGSENVLFFHQKQDDYWGVFRFDMSMPNTRKSSIRVTPAEFNAVTPAAINDTKVAVAVIREQIKTLENTGLSQKRKTNQYRHIEIFDVTEPGKSRQITQKIKESADHFNPFVIDGGMRIGYHRCDVSSLIQNRNEMQRQIQSFPSPLEDVGLFRLSDAFPTISSDGSKLAFVDNEFKAVWLADSQGLRIVLQSENNEGNKFFSPVWNQNPDMDTLYVCMGPSFDLEKPLQIIAIPNVSRGGLNYTLLTEGPFNNAFPSSNPDGTKLVFRSTRGGGENRYRNLYIMEDAADGEDNGNNLIRLTEGKWFDTHCQWSPSGDWIVFSSSRAKHGKDVPDRDQNLDAGYFGVYLVKVSDKNVVIRVISSGYDGAGHVNHPVFSPDGRSIAVTADLAAVSVDPVSLPLFLHSVRPYGDIFTVDINTEDISKNEDIKEFRRITHSRYENSTPTWTMFSTNDPNSQWNVLTFTGRNKFSGPACPYTYEDGGEGWHMTGHLCLAKRCC